MRRTFDKQRLFILIGLLVPTLFLYQAMVEGVSNSTEVVGSEESSYIVQASSADAAEMAVIKIGGRVTATLNIINAVGAVLSEEQADSLRSQAAQITVFKDETLEVSSSVHETFYPSLVGADRLHEAGITGKGVTIAVLDTGLWLAPALLYSAERKRRVLATYDAVNNNNDSDDDDDSDDDSYDDDDNGNNAEDWNGHGTHITSIMMSSDRTESGKYQGIAPNANVVAVRAFEPDGSGTYLNVIKALDWIVSHKKKYHIRIVNLSFGAPARSHYWDDPVNQAVMAVWKKGILVVAAAGNNGPAPMTVGVPGNVPYVITVGAMTDNYTPYDTSDDILAGFSAAGPTSDGFVKPDLVAPGGHMLGTMPPYAWLPLEHPDYVLQTDHYFSMSGTSQATAVVSGVLALMLEKKSKLKPDQAKCRLIASARAAVLDDGTLAYTVFQQGAGRVDAFAAVYEKTSDCANRGLKIKEDVGGRQHFAGLAAVDENGTYYLMDKIGQRRNGLGLEWVQGSLRPVGALWPEGSILPEDSLSATSVLFEEASSLSSDSLLNQGALWPEGNL